MTEKMLQRQIKRYGNDAERFRKKAARCYAAWKEYGDKYDYLNSQQYYHEAERAEEICSNYKIQLYQLEKSGG